VPEMQSRRKQVARHRIQEELERSQAQELHGLAKELMQMAYLVIWSGSLPNPLRPAQVGCTLSGSLHMASMLVVKRSRCRNWSTQCQDKVELARYSLQVIKPMTRCW